jgi:putative ABC transport system permease protein
MLKNYIKTAWRNLLKNKFYSIINIAGLTAGLAIGILILLWVQDELSFDSFHKQAANIYQLSITGGSGSSKQIWSINPAPIGPLAKKQLPEVVDEVRTTGNWDYSLYKYKDKVFGDESAIYADPSYFTMFDFHLVEGNNSNPFTDDNSVVITKKTAAKFFGDADPLGKVIVADNRQNLTVSGVINDFPKNSSISCDMIMPISAHFKVQLAQKNDLSNNFSYLNYQTFLLTKPGISANNLEAKILKLHLSHDPGSTDTHYLLLPITKTHLYNADMTDNGITTVRIFIIIALLILVIACINYVNLSTARAMLRSKEISMRKIVGAAKTQLFLQFIVETTLLFSLAAVLSIMLIYILMPAFNQL